MTEDFTNGAKVLIDEINHELKNSKLSKRDRLIFRVLVYDLESLAPLRYDVAILKKHDAIAWAGRNPKSTWFLGIGFLVLNSMINWAGIRKPLLQGIIHVTTGIMIPLDALP